MSKLFQWLVNFSLQQIAVFGVVIGLMYYFMFFDDGSAIKAQIATMDTQIQQETAKKKDTDTNLQEQERMKKAVGLLSQQYVEISRRIPANLPSIELNRNLDLLAREARVSVKSRRPMSVISSDIVDEIPVQVSLEGTYAQIAQFVYMVSASERVATVKSYNMTPVAPKSSRLKFDATVVGYQLASERKAEPQRRRGGGR